jgi:PAS domain S-box-containing protein
MDMLEGTAPRFVTAAEITRNFGLWQDRAAQGPLIVTHHGRPRCVLLAIDAYQAMTGAPSGPGDAADGEGDTGRHELEYSLLAEHMEGGFVTLDDSLRIRGASSIGALLLGQAAEHLVGHPIEEIVGSSGFGPALAGLRRVLRTGEEAQFDLRLLVGDHRNLRVRAFPWPGGAALILRANEEYDVDERARAEEQALEEARVAHGAIAIVSLTVRATIALVEPGFTSMSGFAAERLTGVRFTDLLALSARREAREAIERVLGGENRAESFSSRLLVNSGEELPVRIALASRSEGFSVGGAMMIITAD